MVNDFPDAYPLGIEERKKIFNLTKHSTHFIIFYRLKDHLNNKR